MFLLETPTYPASSRNFIANARSKIAQLLAGSSVQCVINLFGDSWIEGNYWVRPFAQKIHTAYGMAGVGWTGFQYFGTATGAWVDPGTQPTGGLQGNARSDLVSTPVLSGTWTSDNDGGEGSTSKSIGNITSSEVDAYVRFSFPAGHTSGTLHYNGDGTGVIQYSWDSGSSWSSDVNLSTVGSGHVALASVPAIAGSLRIKVISGNVTLEGVELLSTSTGVRINSLGSSGSNSTQWAASDLPAWADHMSHLDGDLTIGLLGTNDQGGSLAPATFGANITAIMGALQTGDTADLLWLMPPENGLGRSIAMTLYAEQARLAALNEWAYCDLQPIFGTLADYVFGEPGALLDSSNAHPNTAGGLLIRDVVWDILHE